MSATPPRIEEPDDAFLDLVDFKWLMAGVGWWVNLSRLQCDSVYAEECLQRALSSDCSVLRMHSAKLRILWPRSNVDHDASTPSGLRALPVGLQREPAEPEAE